MEYDFSKIKTDYLRVACEYFEAHGTMSCMGIDCYVCPLKERACGCVRKPYVAINKEEKYKLFKEELIRREKMENKMPELEAGMIVEWDFNGEILFDLMINESLYVSLNEDYWRGIPPECDKIINIYKVIGCALSDMLAFKKLIWSKKSDKDIKIEELEKELQHLEEDHSKKVSEIRDRLQELKG